MNKIIKKRNGVKYTIRKDRSRVFFPEEWNSFYNYLRENQKPIFNSLINTGARINEIINIEKRDFDFKKGTLKIRCVKKKSNYSDGKIRIIPISTDYCVYMQEFTKNLKQNDRCFCFTKTSVSQLFKRKLEKSGINNFNDFSLHNIRKTTETWLACLNVNLPIILKHFGHNKSTALNHYINIDFFSINDKYLMRKIIGDLYNNYFGSFIEKKIILLEKEIIKLNRKINKIK
jgi:integrase